MAICPLDAFVSLDIPFLLGKDGIFAFRNQNLPVQNLIS